MTSNSDIHLHIKSIAYLLNDIKKAKLQTPRSIIDALSRYKERLSNPHTGYIYDFDTSKACIESLIALQEHFQTNFIAVNILSKCILEITYRMCEKDELTEIFPLNLVYGSFQEETVRQIDFALQMIEVFHITESDSSLLLLRYKQYLTGLRLWRRAPHDLNESIQTLIYNKDPTKHSLMHKIGKIHVYLIKAEFLAKTGETGLALSFIKKAKHHGYTFNTHDEIVLECTELNQELSYSQQLRDVHDEILKIEPMENFQLANLAPKELQKKIQEKSLSGQ